VETEQKYHPYACDPGKISFKRDNVTRLSDPGEQDLNAWVTFGLEFEIDSRSPELSGSTFLPGTNKVTGKYMVVNQEGKFDVKFDKDFTGVQFTHVYDNYGKILINTGLWEFDIALYSKVICPG
jgi:hypothetical protein